MTTYNPWKLLLTLRNALDGGEPVSGPAVFRLGAYSLMVSVIVYVLFHCNDPAALEGLRLKDQSLLGSVLIQTGGVFLVWRALEGIMTDSMQWMRRVEEEESTE
jgi:hypothetical protein